jgi:hypothetical protein
MIPLHTPPAPFTRPPALVAPAARPSLLSRAAGTVMVGILTPARDLPSRISDLY